MQHTHNAFGRITAFPLRFCSWILAAALAAGPVALARADGAAPTATPADAAPTDAALVAWAMHWFTEMQAGRTDRSQYVPAYVGQITDTAVQALSQELNKYGAAPLRAEVVQTHKDGEQTFAIVKFVFPRGDATSLLFGFDTAGKITGVAAGGIAGD